MNITRSIRVLKKLTTSHYSSTQCDEYSRIYIGTYVILVLKLLLFYRRSPGTTYNMQASSTKRIGARVNKNNIEKVNNHNNLTC